MKLYAIERIYTSYDCYQSFIIYAESEEEVRNYAASRSGRAKDWLDNEITKVVELPEVAGIIHSAWDND